MLTDGFGRVIDYARIAVTSACNLRCTYCLRDETGAPQKTEQLDTDDTTRLIRVLAGMGISKIRFTGGEPLLHPDIASLVNIARTTPGIDTVRLTTNGVLLDRHLKSLIDAGLDGINLSLDTLDREKFIRITRRDHFTQVRKTLDLLLTTTGLTIKINTLLLRGINSDEIPAFVELTRDHAITVRFMELQPFDDFQIWRTGRFMGAEMIRERLFSAFPALEAITGHSTEHYSYRLPGHHGSIAIIPAFSRNFCQSCSKLRITADGNLVSCLYHRDSVALLPSLKSESYPGEIRKQINAAVKLKPKDGLTKGSGHAGSSMSQIGG
jgi:cyclic pyranopterin phosphate synthase